MALGIDIRVLGDKRLTRAFNKLPDVSKKKLVKKVFRESGKRTVVKIAAAIRQAGLVRTGRMAGSYGKRTGRIKALPRRYKDRIGVTIVDPTRQELDIPMSARGYYPYVHEFGVGGSGAVSFIRATVDAVASTELSLMTARMATIIEKDFKALAGGTISRGV